MTRPLDQIIREEAIDCMFIAVGWLGEKDLSREEARERFEQIIRQAIERAGTEKAKAGME